MVARAAKAASHGAAASGHNLSLHWALAELRKQFGGDGLSLEAHLARPRAPAGPLQTPSEGSLGGSCATPTSSDGSSGAARHGHVQQQQHAQSGGRSVTPLSVHWAEALEQLPSRQHAPHHTQHAPDKPCLKPQQSSFPYLDEAAQLEGLLLRRPWADGGSPPAAKKRSRLAAFGQ